MLMQESFTWHDDDDSSSGEIMRSSNQEIEAVSFLALPSPISSINATRMLPK